MAVMFCPGCGYGFLEGETKCTSVLSSIMQAKREKETNAKMNALWVPLDPQYQIPGGQLFYTKDTKDIRELTHGKITALVCAHPGSYIEQLQLSWDGECHLDMLTLAKEVALCRIDYNHRCYNNIYYTQWKGDASASRPFDHLGNRVPWQPTPAPAQPAGSPADAEAEASADLVHYGGPSAGSDGSGGGGPGGGGGEGGRRSRWRRRRCASGKAPDVRAHNSGVPGL